MVQRPSWEASWFAASQEIPRILWNPEVHYRTHRTTESILDWKRPWTRTENNIKMENNIEIEVR